MFEGNKKILRRWYLEIDGDRIPVRKLSDAVRLGKQAYDINNGAVKLIETERLWFGKVKSEMKQLSFEEFDRTNLISK